MVINNGRKVQYQIIIIVKRSLDQYYTCIYLQFIFMNAEDLEEKTGWRPVFQFLPSNRNMAQHIVMPLGIFYSPFQTQVNELKKGKPSVCVKCNAVLNSFCPRERQLNKWVCKFCLSDNPLNNNGLGLEAVQQSYEGKFGDSGLFFIVDLCMSEEQLQSIKNALVKTVSKLPQHLFVGLMAYNQNILLANFEEEEVSYVCFSGEQNFPNLASVGQVLGIANNMQHNVQKALVNKYYVPLNKNTDKLIQAIQDLSIDTHDVSRDSRPKRASGTALQVAINTICSIGIHTRFVSIMSGPCTIGPGKVVQLPLKQTIRVYMDIIEGSSNAALVKPATKFYQTLAKTIIQQKCTLDIWAYGLDQFGLLQMRDMVNQSGGVIAMHEQFDHFIFKQSFDRFYEPNQIGTLNFPFACTLRVRISKQMKINGILGTCKSLGENTLKTAAQMQVGEGNTNEWYLGGIAFNNSLCIVVSHSDIQTKQKGYLIQAVTTFKYSDNILRTKVSTIHLSHLRMPQYREMMRGFDENAAAVMLARMASKKSQIEDISEVKKWLDRLLLKFTVRFAQFHKGNGSSFRLINQMRHFPQFIYHLRRSSLVNHFGCPPDQAIYMRTCLLRQSLPNCMVMIQSALLKYHTNNINEQGVIEPEPVQLDFKQMKDQAVLLMDSYFNVIVWFGENVYGWKQQKLNQDPQFQYLTQLFQAPMRDASQVMYDRLPISNFYETFKNDGKQRYLKARVNPSSENQMQNDGNFVTDDASIQVFMKFLIRSVVSYNE